VPNRHVRVEIILVLVCSMFRLNSVYVLVIILWIISKSYKIQSKSYEIVWNYPNRVFVVRDRFCRPPFRGLYFLFLSIGLSSRFLEIH
jgi:hypothetical protein